MKSFRIILLLCAAISLCACGGHRHQDPSAIIEQTQDAFYKAMDDSTITLVQLRPSASAFQEELMEMASNKSSRAQRLDAQRVAEATVIDLVHRSELQDISKSPSEQMALTGMITDFVSVQNQWIVEDLHEEGVHVYKEVPIKTGRQSGSVTEDYFFVDCIVPTSGQPVSRVIIRFPQDAVSSPIAYFVKYSDDLRQEIDKKGFRLGELVKMDIPGAPGSSVAVADQNLVDLMLHYDKMFLSYSTKENPVDLNDSFETTNFYLFKFQESYRVAKQSFDSNDSLQQLPATDTVAEN